MSLDRNPRQGTIVKLTEWQGVSQRALTGQRICFPRSPPSDGPELAASANRHKTQFPLRVQINETRTEQARVAFVGSDKADKYMGAGCER